MMMKGMWLIQGKKRINLAHVYRITPEIDEGRDRLYLCAEGGIGMAIDPAKTVQIVSDEVMLQMLRAELIVENPPRP